MSEKYRGRVPLMILAVFISVMLWMQVQTQDILRTMPANFSAQLQTRNLDNTLYSVVEMPESVAIRAEGSEEEINKINPDKIEAFVDLENVELGRNRVQVQLNAPSEYRAEIFPVNRLVTVEVELLVKQEFPVTVETRGLLREENLVFSDAVAHPTEVMIEGPKSRVELVQKIRALLDLSSVNPGTAYPIKVEALTEGNKPVPLITITPDTVTISPAITPAPESKSVLVVPKFKNQPDFGYVVRDVSVTPNQVKIRGRSQILAGMTTVDTLPIDLSGMTESKAFVIRLDLPTNVRAVGSGDVTVRVEIAKDATPAPIPMDLTPSGNS